MTNQQIAVLGMVVRTRGRSPRKKPVQPLRLYMIEAACQRPLACLISRSLEVPRVCRSVLTTSSGVVIAAATAPAKPPAVMWVATSYFFPGLRTLEMDSYAVNWMAVNGIVMLSVVG